MQRYGTKVSRFDSNRNEINSYIVEFNHFYIDSESRRFIVLIPTKGILVLEYSETGEREL